MKIIQPGVGQDDLPRENGKPSPNPERRPLQNIVGQASLPVVLQLIQANWTGWKPVPTTQAAKAARQKETSK
jgi:hypothetical protein